MLGKIAFSDPLLDAGMRGWIVNTAIKNHWRVARWIDVDDLVQEGLFCFVRCRNRYRQFAVVRPTLQQRRHFMALVKVSFINSIHTLANARTAAAEVLVNDLPPETLPPDPIGFQDGALRVLIGQLPLELQEVLVLLATDVTRLERFGLTNFRESLNEHVARLLGLPALDYVGLIRKSLF